MFAHVRFFISSSSLTLILFMRSQEKMQEIQVLSETGSKTFFLEDRRISYPLPARNQ